VGESKIILAKMIVFLEQIPLSREKSLILLFTIALQHRLLFCWRFVSYRTDKPQLATNATMLLLNCLDVFGVAAVIV
jgi:hypothetical protein